MSIFSDFVSAMFDLTETARFAILNPADQIKALIPLCSYKAPAAPEGTSRLSTAVRAVSEGTAAVSRRAALTSLGLACADFEPTSSDETIKILNRITPLFEAEITYAADVGDLDAYVALRALASAVVDDLQTRGSLLPELIVVERTKSLPSLVLAHQLYRDADRSDDLIQRSGAANPAFCPIKFTALSS